MLILLGWQLGSDPEIQVATNVTNHLTAATMKYFADSYRLGRAANLFEKIGEKEPEVAALLARSYIGMSKSSPISLSTDGQMELTTARRRDQSGSSDAQCPSTTPTILPYPTRPMRFPAVERKSRLGPKSRPASRQFRTFGVCHLGKIDGNVYRAGSIR